VVTGGMDNMLGEGVVCNGFAFNAKEGTD